MMTEMAQQNELPSLFWHQAQLVTDVPQRYTRGDTWGANQDNHMHIVDDDVFGRVGDRGPGDHKS